MGVDVSTNLIGKGKITKFVTVAIKPFKLEDVRKIPYLLVGIQWFNITEVRAFLLQTVFCCEHVTFYL